MEESIILGSGESEMLSQAEKMLTDGATFIDIGGYSTKKCRICYRGRA
jgi:dihydropteroate synthase